MEIYKTQQCHHRRVHNFEGKPPLVRGVHGSVLEKRSSDERLDTTKHVGGARWLKLLSTGPQPKQASLVAAVQPSLATADSSILESI